MQFGAMNFPVKPILDEIDTFTRLGFDYLELAMDPPMAHHSIIEENQSAIKKALSDSGLGLVCHLPTFVATADLTESIRSASQMEMHRSLDIAHTLGAKKVVLHPSMVGGMGGFVLHTVKTHFCDFLAEMVSHAAGSGITICLENMFPRNLLGVEVQDFEEVFSQFPTLKLTLDTGHANIGDYDGNRLTQLVEKLGLQIGHLHFSDNRGRWDEHLAVGKGSVNFKKLIRNLRDIGYNDTITLEVFDDDRQMLVESRRRIEGWLAGRWF